LINHLDGVHPIDEATPASCIPPVDNASSSVDPDLGRARIGEHWIADDDVVSLDGTAGEVFVGQVARNAPPPDADLARILAWKERFAKGRRP